MQLEPPKKEAGKKKSNDGRAKKKGAHPPPAKDGPNRQCGAPDSSIQGRLTHNPGLDHPGCGPGATDWNILGGPGIINKAPWTGTSWEPRSQEETQPDWSIWGRPGRQAAGPLGLEHPGGCGPKPWSGSSEMEASGPGLEHPERHKKKEKTAERRTRSEGMKDHQWRANQHEIIQGKREHDQRPGDNVSEEGDEGHNKRGGMGTKERPGQGQPGRAGRRRCHK